jgi:CheY-like chemotaxis protein
LSEAFVELGTVLAVDDSIVMRELLRAILKVHTEAVHTAGSITEARDELRWHGDLDLVLADVHLRDGNALDLLEQEGAAHPERRWIVMTARPDEDDRKRALDLGALAYLTKPISFRDIVRAARGRAPVRPPVPRAPRARPCPTVYALDFAKAHHQLLAWDLVDLSATGAFLATPSSIAVGSRVLLGLTLDGELVRVLATVVRVQEPAWGRCGGVGVRFEDLDQRTSAALAELVHRSLRGACDA